ncbi:Putative F-box domain-containing protein [Septoria linicola]|uniref:F-box domain-containing protein n=1 Tax=Septoria linicola TaxID=215465 RepID=A0A9Q9B8N6_9PEZI|nr:Putative F-box domain-containing protein [Septoria linicola]
MGQQFADHILTQWQAKSIDTIHIHDLVESTSEFAMLQRSFPALKHLKLTWEANEMFEDLLTGDYDYSDTFFSGGSLETVEMIRRSDECYLAAPRPDRRAVAGHIEELILRRSKINWSRPIVYKGAYGAGKVNDSRSLDREGEAEGTLSPREIYQRDSEAVRSAVHYLRTARDLVPRCCANDDLDFDDLKAELASAREEIARLKSVIHSNEADVSAERDVSRSSPIESLPVELLSRVFSYLDDKADVKSSRLVSRGFREQSSPFLITQVVYAARVGSVARLLDVIEHPYFSKHVTQRLPDSSYYDKDTANDPETYGEAAKRAAWGTD